MVPCVVLHKAQTLLPVLVKGNNIVARTDGRRVPTPTNEGIKRSRTSRHNQPEHGLCCIGQRPGHTICTVLLKQPKKFAEDAISRYMRRQAVLTCAHQTTRTPKTLLPPPTAGIASHALSTPRSLGNALPAFCELLNENRHVF